MRRTEPEGYPPIFGERFKNLRERDPGAREAAIKFLEDDPYFFRSGYAKADYVMPYVRNIALEESDLLRLQNVVLKAIQKQYCREFRHYCKIARVVSDSRFLAEVAHLMNDLDSDVRRRARWVMAAIGSPPEYYLDRGVRAFNDKDYSRALKCFDQSMILDPDSIYGLLWRGKAYAVLGKHKDAIENFTEAIDMNVVVRHDRYSAKRHRNCDYELYYLRARSYLMNRQYGNAIPDFSRFLKEKPEVINALLGRAQAYMGLQKFDLAIDDLNRGILEEPGNADAYHLRGVCYAKLDQYTEAIIDLENAANLAPLSASIQIDLLLSYTAVGECEKAVELATIARRSNLKNYFVLFSRGMALFDLGRFTDALNDFTTCIENEPTLVGGECYEWRAKVYDKLGMPELADLDRIALSMVQS